MYAQPQKTVSRKTDVEAHDLYSWIDLVPEYYQHYKFASSQRGCCEATIELSILLAHTKNYTLKRKWGCISPEYSA